MTDEDASLVREATPDETLARDLAGRRIKVECSGLPIARCSNVTFANTGETIPGIRRVEVILDAHTDTLSAKLYRWKDNSPDEPSLRYAETTNVAVSTLAVVEG